MTKTERAWPMELRMKVIVNPGTSQIQILVTQTLVAIGDRVNSNVAETKSLCDTVVLEHFDD